MTNDTEVHALESKNNLTLKKRMELAGLSDPKVVLAWVSGIVLFFCFVLPILKMATAFALPLLAFPGLYFMSCMFVGLAFGFLMVFAIRTGSRLFLGTNQKLAKIAEERLASGASSDLEDDLNTLITENLKLKRYQVAEFYSKQLLEMAEKPIKPEAIKATSCWVNSEEYQGSFRYKFVWLFENKGTMSLTSTNFQIESPKVSFDVPLENLLEVKMDRHPLWIKPYPMKFLVVTFKEKGFEHTYYLSPNYLQTDTVVDINNYVKEWYGYLTKAIAKNKQASLLQRLGDSVEETSTEPEDIGQLIDQMNNI